MQQVLKRVLHDIRYFQGQKEKKRVRRIANAAIDRVKEALRKNPELAAMLGFPLDEEGKKPEVVKAAEKKARKPKKTPAQKRMVAKVLGPSAVITRLRMGKNGVSCQFDHYGEKAPESYTEGSMIYINVDHPFFKREARHRDRHFVNITRLLTQEIAVLKFPRNSRQAIECQSKLLTDSLVDKK